MRCHCRDMIHLPAPQGDGATLSIALELTQQAGLEASYSLPGNLCQGTAEGTGTWGCGEGVRHKQGAKMPALRSVWTGTRGLFGLLRFASQLLRKILAKAVTAAVNCSLDIFPDGPVGFII